MQLVELAAMCWQEAGSKDMRRQGSTNQSYRIPHRDHLKVSITSAWHKQWSHTPTSNHQSSSPAWALLQETQQIKAATKMKAYSIKLEISTAAGVDFWCNMEHKHVQYADSIRLIKVP